MKTIDVKTTQNVVITYELASFKERFFAWFIDTLIKSIAVSIFLFLAFVVFEIDIEEVLIVYMICTVFVTVTFYSLLFEALWHGQTPGKAILGIKVMKVNGRQTVFYDHLVRWIFRILDIYLSAGIFGSIVLLSNTRNQRLGDLLSNTCVIKLSKKNTSVTLKQLLELDSRISYEPVYLQIKNFREEDIVLIKQTLDRYQRFRNQGHKEALQELADKMADRLNLRKEEIINPTNFLKTLIRDYVVLTR